MAVGDLRRLLSFALAAIAPQRLLLTCRKTKLWRRTSRTRKVQQLSLGLLTLLGRAPSDNTPEFAVEDLTEGLDDLNFGDKKKKKKKKPAAEVVRQQLCFPFNACV